MSDGHDATEHVVFVGSLVCSNIGLGGDAVRGPRWGRHHSGVVQNLSRELCREKSDLMCLCFCEVGSVDEPYTTEEQHKFEKVVRDGCREANYRVTQFQWSRAWPRECLTVFLNDQKYKRLPRLEKIGSLPRFRVAERFEIYSRLRGHGA